MAILPDGGAFATDDGSGTASVPGTALTYSVVIPVLNGAVYVGETIDRVLAFFTARGLRGEIIVVNDGSTDRTWDVVKRLAERNRDIVAIDLLQNYGQHPATMCGLRASTGDYVITMDDDLQHAPDAIDQLIAKAHEGHDVVFARFRSKQHALYKRLGSRVVTWINRAAFGLPSDLVVSSFRLIRRDVVDRMVEHEFGRPYVTGLAAMHARSPANALIEHHASVRGHTTYGISHLFVLMATIVWNALRERMARRRARSTLARSYEVREIVRFAKG
jgi:glycosyltransferase involved in cell wall biosynthesis